MPTMNLAFLSTGDFGVPALMALARAGHAIVRVVSQPDRPAGRGRQIHPTPIHAAAERLGLPHVQSADVNAHDPREIIDDARLAVVVDFGQKIGPALLAAAPLGFINIHGSLLPRYRGAAPFQWAMINGDATTGVTVFQLNERWDAGAILGRRETPIRDDETADELHDRLAILGAELVVEVVAALEAGTARPLPQDDARASRAPKLRRADSAIDWSQPAERIVRRIHGLWSWPGAACVFHSRSGKREQIRIARAAVAATPVGAPPPHAQPGDFLDDLCVQCGQGRIRLLDVQPAGGKQMPFAAFANGRHVSAGDRLERD